MDIHTVVTHHAVCPECGARFEYSLPLMKFFREPVECPACCYEFLPMGRTLTAAFV
jgi:hypothetical protein